MEGRTRKLDGVEGKVAVQVLTSLADSSGKLGLAGTKDRRGGRIAVELLLKKSLKATRVSGGGFLTAATATESGTRSSRDLASIHGFSQPLISTQGCPFLPLV